MVVWDKNIPHWLYTPFCCLYAKWFFMILGGICVTHKTAINFLIDATVFLWLVGMNSDSLLRQQVFVGHGCILEMLWRILVYIYIVFDQREEQGWEKCIGWARSSLVPFWNLVFCSGKMSEGKNQISDGWVHPRKPKNWCFLPAPSKGWQLNPKGWWIDTL